MVNLGKVIFFLAFRVLLFLYIGFLFFLLLVGGYELIKCVFHEFLISDNLLDTLFEFTGILLHFAHFLPKVLLDLVRYLLDISLNVFEQLFGGPIVLFFDD